MKMQLNSLNFAYNDLFGKLVSSTYECLYSLEQGCHYTEGAPYCTVQE